MVSIPNILSIIRILLLFPVIYFLSKDNNIAAFCLIITAMLTDFFDGYWARRFKQISVTGKLLDPFADKIFIAVLALMLVIDRDLPLWFLFLLIIKDLLIFLFGFYVLRKRGILTESNIIGKISINVFLSVLIVFVMEWDILKVPLLVLGTVFALFSVLSYAVNFIRKIKHYS